MKKNIHPKYQKVLFVDSASGHRFVCGSTLQTKETEKFEGQEYPVCRLSVSSASHPFFTGSKALVDAEGRVDKFKKRYKQNSQDKQESQENGEN
jgi:large subunit ribosomal protein L31